ncbi:hypothetical protein HSX11_15450 [Oxalobacteraceae bacterium]|nr:hypothetical protein [Oxalobacteraceae bacterium]
MGSKSAAACLVYGGGFFGRKKRQDVPAFLGTIVSSYLADAAIEADAEPEAEAEAEPFFAFLAFGAEASADAEADADAIGAEADAEAEGAAAKAEAANRDATRATISLDMINSFAVEGKH